VSFVAEVGDLGLIGNLFFIGSSSQYFNFTLPAPFFWFFHQTRTNRIVQNVIPFLFVAFFATQQMVKKFWLQTFPSMPHAFFIFLLVHSFQNFIKTESSLASPPGAQKK
jgi:hypothetical protein